MKKDWDILVIDDEQVVIDAVIKICSAEGYSVDFAADAKEALKKFDQSSGSAGKNIYKLIICDIMMPVIDGFGFLNELSKRKISTPVIMTTGYSTVENAVKSLYNGAIDFIPKPFTADEIINSVLRGFKYLSIQNSLKNHRKEDAEIIYVPCPAKYFRLGYSSWVSEENTGSVITGATDLFIKILESLSPGAEAITDIELMQIDDEVVQGNICAHLKDKEERLHPLLSPVSGRIIEVNEELKNNKSLVEKDPYFEGWFYRIIPSDSGYELKNLINCSSDRY
jgi:CheY-like chemotaxis protein/glycine cleavage system H lipoate-binding protein